MSAHPLPMDVEDERLWFVGLLGFLLIGLLGVWMMVPTGTAAFQISGASDGTPVNVTIEGPADGGQELLAQETVRDQQATVFTTSEPGWYIVTISTEETSCEQRVSLTRRDNKLQKDDLDLNTDSCPVEFSVQMRLI